MNRFSGGRRAVFAGWVLAAVGTGAGAWLLGTCGPFADTAADAFCPFVLEIFTLGITTGTTATTYSPGDPVTRLQMAAFLSRMVDAVLRRESPKARLEKSWTPGASGSLALTTVGNQPISCACDGTDVWVVNTLSSSVSRLRASDGRVLETWTGTSAGYHAVVSPLGIVVTSQFQPTPKLYRIEPSQACCAATAVVSAIGDIFSRGIAFDGARYWTANASSVSIVTPAPSPPWTVTVVTAGFNQPEGALFDGANVWITDFNAGTLLKLASSGSILQTVTVGTHPEFPIFDGVNIWVPVSGADAIAVVRPSSGAILATLTGNGLDDPIGVAFDGERILVANLLGGRVSLWKAADTAPAGSVSTGAGTTPRGACSDGSSFWIPLVGSGVVARF